MPCVEADGQLPVTRYKVKVEEASATKGVTAANDNDDADADADADSFACPTLAELVLTPLGGTKPSGAERERKLVTVRGLKPSTSYRVQVCPFLTCSRARAGRSYRLKCAAAIIPPGALFPFGILTSQRALSHWAPRPRVKAPENVICPAPVEGFLSHWKALVVPGALATRRPESGAFSGEGDIVGTPREWVNRSVPKRTGYTSADSVCYSWFRDIGAVYLEGACGHQMPRWTATRGLRCRGRC